MGDTRILRGLRLVGMSLLLLGATARADVLVVIEAGGPDADFTDLPAAVAAAAEGDILLVRQGAYSGFTLDKGLTIIAEAGHQPRLSGSIVVQGLSPGSTATLAGLSPVKNLTLGEYDELRLELRSNAGSVFVRDSLFRSLDPQFPAVDVDAANVLSMQSCGVLAGPKSLTPGPTMQLEGSEVFLHLTAVNGSLGKKATPVVVGGGASQPGGPGGPAITVIDSRLLIDKCVVRGGKGGQGTNVPCSDGGPGGAGIIMTGESSRIVTREPFVQGGMGGISIGLACGSGPPGPPYDIEAGEVTNVPGIARFLDLNSPVREGFPLTIYPDGQFGDQVYLVLSFATAPVFVPGAQLLLINGAPLKVFPLGQHPPAVFATTVTAPYVPAVLDGYVVHAQAIFVGMSGQLHSSNGHEIVLLSDVF